ncbi:N-(5'-phosphoribosyl)anthranilate isomerase [Frondihabitans sucicola]|uniref:N-(5'-phosphoribosyl)anthranilate isomerase n=1 Tax=Frondihabitans sucicola TaxID=1268041 RepID=A0ABN6XWA3_9MICO|nr:phosphoribosylanthranilate isomerase [Frondihabitans sucicola]BDZ48197.1 N-(5'-phosphoribosyl)anthranilate isomerase [Frondihabitans sucicola]
MWIKICGLSTPETLDAAVTAGADATGFVFAPGSPRLVDAAHARELVARVPEGVETVGVFRDQPLDDVLRLARAAGVRTVQLHGHEDPAYFEAVRRAGFPVIRAISADTFVRESQDHAGSFGEARLLLDAPDPGAGATFAESTLAGSPLPLGWILAGGLTPENVVRLTKTLAPSGVDVSSGVESSRGVKSPDAIRAFVSAARS